MAEKSKDAKETKELKNLCTPKRLSRTNFFSDTYTAPVLLDGEKRIMDITRIAIPFSAEREKAVMEYYGIAKKDVGDFYTKFAQAITNEVSVLNKLHQSKVDSLVNYLSCKVIGHSTYKELYLVSEHLRPIKQVYFKDTTTYAQILDFGLRLCKIVNDINKLRPGTVLRALDADMIYVNDEGHIILGGLMYAYDPESKVSHVPFLNTAPLHIEGQVLTGSHGDIGTDMYTIASMLWSLFNGDGFDIQTPRHIKPKYALEGLKEILEIGLEADPDKFGLFRSKLSQYRKAISKERADPETHEWYEPIYIPVPAAEKCIPEPDVIFDYETVEAAETVASEKATLVTEVVETTATTTTEEALVPAPEPTKAAAEFTEEPSAAAEGSVRHVAQPSAEEPAVAAKPAEPKAAAAPEPMVAAAEVYKTEYVYTLTEQDIVTDSVSETETSVIRPSKKLENEPAAYEFNRMTSFDDLQFEYHKPKFVLSEIALIVALAAIAAMILYISLETHMISFW